MRTGLTKKQKTTMIYFDEHSRMIEVQTYMPKKKLPQTIEECNAELERTQKQLQQYENRNKMLNRKLSIEKRKERNHRIFLYGGFLESIVPELKTMTEDEGKDFLYHIAKGVEAQEYLKKRTEGVEAG